MSLRSTTVTDEKNSKKSNEDGIKKARSLLPGTALFRFLSLRSDDSYKPEKHYMRGPGPKAKASATRVEVNADSCADIKK